MGAWKGVGNAVAGQGRVIMRIPAIIPVKRVGQLASSGLRRRLKNRLPVCGTSPVKRSPELVFNRMFMVN